MKFSSLVLTNENLEQSANVTDDTIAAGQIGTTSSEDEVDGLMSAAESTDNETDLVSAVDNIDDIDTGIDSGTDAIEALGSVSGLLSENDEPGLSDTESKLVEATHESIMASLGLPVVKLSLESLSYATQRHQAIATLEAEGESIKDKIVAGFKAVFNYLVNFIQNLLKNTWVLEKYLNYVVKKTANLKGSPKNKTMSQSAKALSANGKADMDSVGKMKATADGMMAMADKIADSLNATNFKSMLESEETTPFKELLVDQGKLPGNNSSFSDKKESKWGYLVNGRAFQSEGSFIISASHGGIQTSSVTAQEIDVATPSDIQRLLGLAKDIIKKIKSYDQKTSVFKNALSSITQYVAQDFATTAGIVSKSSKDLSEKLGAIRSYRNVLKHGAAYYPLESFKIAKAFIDYARHSANQYDGVDVKAEDK